MTKECLKWLERKSNKLNKMNLKIKDWNDLIIFYNRCMKDNLYCCKNCILSNIYGEWDQEEIDEFSVKKVIRKRDSVCFLIARRNQDTPHSLEKIKKIILIPK